jgi:hypothetical protein
MDTVDVDAFYVLVLKRKKKSTKKNVNINHVRQKLTRDKNFSCLLSPSSEKK